MLLAIRPFVVKLDYCIVQNKGNKGPLKLFQLYIAS